MYGRSPLENSSFIASSANPNKKIHGKGFVARLSGSTAEFLQIWQLMMFGSRPFVMKDGELTLDLMPCIPSYLAEGVDVIETTFLGSIKTVYRLNGLKALIPGGYSIKEISLERADGSSVTKTAVTGEDARLRRSGEYTKMTVEFA